MQRDVYAALVKKTFKEMIPLQILQLSGEITHERVYDEVFDGHRLRRLILMTNMRGTDPNKGPRLEKDVTVESFDKLKQLHQPHFQYKLLPLLCDSVATFHALQGIVTSPGSPFRIEHRRDPITLRMSFGSAAHRTELCELLLPDTAEDQRMVSPAHRRLPLPNNGISYAGILSNLEPAAVKRGGFSGTVNVVDSISEGIIKEYGVMHRLVHSAFYRRRFCSDEVQLHREYFSARNVFHFLAVRRPIVNDVRPSLVQCAQANKIHLYEERNGEFVFVN